MGKQSRRRRQNTASSSSEVEHDVAASLLSPTNGEEASVSVASAASPHPSSSTIPSGASCWICLDEGPGENGQPIVRDCSCRGESGFCHFSCIVKYAEQKSKAWDELGNNGLAYEMGDYSKPWHECPNCNQEYQKQLKLNLADALISFTKKLYPCHPAIKCFAFPCDPGMLIEALYVKMGAYYDMVQKSSELKDELHYYGESKRVALEIISVVDTLRAHSVKIYGKSSVPGTVISAEGTAYHQLGLSLGGEFSMNPRKNGDAAKSAISYFEKSRDLAKSIGDIINVNAAEAKIAQMKNWYQKGRSNMKGSIKAPREEYKQDPDQGKPLVHALLTEFHIIECERTLAEMIARNRRLHGPNHSETTSLEEWMVNIKKRKAMSMSPGSEGIYDILRYDDDSDKYVLHGPWMKLNCPAEDARNVKAEEVKTIIADADDLILCPGTPVICHGLRNASHLNDKIGDAREFKKEMGRYSVHFEDPSLKSCLIKPGNLRVLFDLPTKASS